MAATVLVVDDEPKIRDLLRGYLEREGLAVLSTGSGAEAIQLADRAPLDLVLLDLRLPDVPGEEVAREIRQRGPTPIIMLTAKTDPAERIRGLEIGADDYVTKPFSPREVVLRVRAVLRRSGAVAAQPPQRFGQGELVIDAERHQVTVRGVQVQLTATQWRLLDALASHPERVYSRGELVNRVLGYEFEGYERTVDSHVKNLRQKIEIDPHQPRIVGTVQGTGYRFELTRDSGSDAGPAGTSGGSEEGGRPDRPLRSQAPA